MADVAAVVARVTSGIIAQMAERYSLEPEQLMTTLRRSIIAPKKVKTDQQGGYKLVEASNEEIITFLQVAKQYELNPFIKEIVAFVAARGQVVPYVTIDGWISLINRNKRFAGLKALPQYDDNKKLYAYTIIGRVKDEDSPTGSYEVEITELMEECKRSTDPWASHPSRMLRHKAIIQWGRVAFGYSGLYDQDEAERIVEAEDNRSAIDVTEATRALMPKAKALTPATAPPKPATEQAAPKETVVKGNPTPAPATAPEVVIQPSVGQMLEAEREPGSDEGEGIEAEVLEGPEATPAPAAPKDEKSMTDEEKRAEILLLAKKYAETRDGSSINAIKSFSAFDSGGEKIATGDVNKLKGKWLNTTLGKARTMAGGT